MPRCRASLALVLAACLPFAAPAVAGPPEIVAALKAEPANLFDLSLSRLEALVQADGLEGEYHAWVYHQDDQIHVTVWSLSAPPTEEACRDILDRIKRLAAVDPETGFPDDPASRFAAYFSYTRIAAYEIDPTYEETLDSMFHLRAVIGIAGDGQAVICNSGLLSRETRFSRE